MSVWTDEKIEELKRLWEAGHTASVIGKMLGVSKNAVVGKAHRMNLSARPSPIKKGVSRPRVQRGAEITTGLESIIKKVEVDAAKSPVESLTEPVMPRTVSPKDAKGPKCLWPIGDPGDPDFHFCGDGAVSGKPYCAAHCEKAYITKSRAETEAA